MINIKMWILAPSRVIWCKYCYVFFVFWCLNNTLHRLLRCYTWYHQIHWLGHSKHIHDKLTFNSFLCHLKKLCCWQC